MERPKGITVIVIYYIGSATVLIPLVLLLSRKDMNLFHQSALLIIAPILIVLSVGLWKMKNWARISATVLTAVGLVDGVVPRGLNAFSYFGIGFLDFGIWYLAIDLIVLGLQLWMVIYLLSSRVRRAFMS